MPDDERELIERWRAGDRKAFGELVRLYMSDAYLIALGFAGNSEDARDLSQDAFVKAFEARKKFDPTRPFYPWLYRILKNHCLNFVQRKARKHEPLYYDEQPSQERFASGGRTPLEELEKEERVAIMRAAIEQLSFEHREVIILKNFKGYSYQQMAEVLDIPIGTVMSRLYYARKMLKDKVLELEQKGVHHTPTIWPHGRTAPEEV